MTMKKVIEEVKRDLVEPDPNQPRKYFDETKLIELGTDISINGILQAIVVRPHPTSKGRYMIVFGERRYRAAGPGYAELETVPVVVHPDVNDAQALEWQMAENGKRDDMHPLEEADGYRTMHERDGRDVEEIAEISGKSMAYVYASMKLCALTAEPRKAFFAGKFDKSVALLIARLPESQQGQATKAIMNDGDSWDRDDNSTVMSFREAKQYIRDEFMLRLATAPFKIDDETLSPKAGPCTTCPKRTGNQRELFSDVVEDKNGGADVCTDSACFKTKADVHWSRIAEVAKKRGRQVLEGKAAENAGGYGDKHVRLDDHCSDDAKNRTYRQLLGKSAEEAVTAIARGAAGQVKELVAKAELPKLLKAAGVKIKKETSSHSTSTERKKEREESKRSEELEQNILARVEEAAIAKVPAVAGVDVWRLLVRMSIRNQAYRANLAGIIERLKGRTGIDLTFAEDGGDVPEDVALFRVVDKMDDVTRLAGLLFEVLLGRADFFELEDDGRPKKNDKMFDDWRAQDQSNLLDAVEVLGVDVKALTREATKAFELAAEQRRVDKELGKQKDGELPIPHKPGCELERFVFVAAGAGVEYHPRKGGKTSTGAGGFSERKCPKCDSGVTTPALPAKPKQKATNGMAPAPEQGIAS